MMHVARRIAHEMNCNTSRETRQLFFPRTRNFLLHSRCRGKEKNVL